MEKKDTVKPPHSLHVDNSSNNIYGVVYGNVGNTTNNITGPRPQEGDRPVDPVERGIWKSGVVDHVANGRMKEALAEILKTRPPEEVLHQVALLSGRLSQLEIQTMAGIINKELELEELNKIRTGILTLISRL